MAGSEHQNGYVRLNTLVGVGLPVLGVFAAAIAIYVNLSISPLERDIEQNYQSINSIRADLVPRKEHDRDWDAESARFADLQRQIDREDRDLHDVYNAHDAIQDLTNRLTMLEHPEKKQPDKEH